jgi:uncharacterized phiE125 gp8 family phage protein
MIDALKMMEAHALADGTVSGDAVMVSFTDPSALTVAEPITLEQAKAHLRVVVADEDDYISGLILAARQMAEGRLNRTLVQRARAARFSGWGDRMPLLKPPVISVDNIGYIDETGGEVMLDASRYYLTPVEEDELPEVELRSGESFPVLDRRAKPITVYYTAGYAAGQVPQPIIQWMLLAIGTLYANRESEVVGATVAPLPDDFMKWLLQPYRVYE